MGGCPFVLAEHEKNLERLGIEAIKPPQDFWDKLTKNPSVPRRDVPLEAREAWRKTLPPDADYKVVRRVAGLGSLGQRRFVAIVMHEGGYLAREAKATIPSASVWKEGEKRTRRTLLREGDFFSRSVSRPVPVSIRKLVDPALIS